MHPRLTLATITHLFFTITLALPIAVHALGLPQKPPDENPPGGNGGSSTVDSVTIMADRHESKKDESPASNSPAAPAKTTKTVSKSVEATPTPAQIADAKAKGLVWVNKSTKTYHKVGDRHYGATKSGEFKTEADAKKTGYHAAKGGESN